MSTTYFHLCLLTFWEKGDPTECHFFRVYRRFLTSNWNYQDSLISDDIAATSFLVSLKTIEFRCWKVALKKKRKKKKKKKNPGEGTWNKIRITNSPLTFVATILDGSLIIQFYNGVLILVEMDLTACYGTISHFTFITKFKIFYSNMACFNSVFYSSWAKFYSFLWKRVSFIYKKSKMQCL